MDKNFGAQIWATRPEILAHISAPISAHMSLNDFGSQFSANLIRASNFGHQKRISLMIARDCPENINCSTQPVSAPPHRHPYMPAPMQLRAPFSARGVSGTSAIEMLLVVIEIVSPLMGDGRTA